MTKLEAEEIVKRLTRPSGLINAEAIIDQTSNEWCVSVNCPGGRSILILGTDKQGRYHAIDTVTRQTTIADIGLGDMSSDLFC